MFTTSIVTFVVFVAFVALVVILIIGGSQYSHGVGGESTQEPFTMLKEQLSQSPARYVVFASRIVSLPLIIHSHKSSAAFPRLLPIVAPREYMAQFDMFK